MTKRSVLSFVVSWVRDGARGTFRNLLTTTHILRNGGEHLARELSPQRADQIRDWIIAD